MRKIVAAVMACSALGAFVATGGAAQASDTSTSFTLTAAGGLSVSAPASKSLGSVATNAGTVSAQLGATTVTDLRGALGASWTATVVASDFTTGAATADETIGKANVSYWSGAATATTGTAVFVPGQLTNLLAAVIDSAQTAFSATGTVGNNSATWNPTVTITVPADSVVGSYAGTITHSVA